jgi:hypothetical protein
MGEMAHLECRCRSPHPVDASERQLVAGKRQPVQ